MHKIFGKTKHIHFIGIGGIGMSGMAELLYNHGFQVSGSDINKSDIISYLSILVVPTKIGCTILLHSWTFFNIAKFFSLSVLKI